MLFRIIPFTFGNIRNVPVRQLGGRLLHTGKKVLVIALIRIPGAAGGFEHIHITLRVRACKIDEGHVAFRCSVRCLHEIRPFLERDRERLVGRIAVFRRCTAKIAILENLVGLCIELCLDELLIKAAECLIRPVHIFEHFIGFFLVCTIGMERKDRCSHRRKHAVVKVAFHVGFQAELFQILQRCGK